ncbi:hypothetical protein EKO23_01875 [Nocardioides guangzhouensis]|uniref:HEPN AbiU2-like domain-containing protein n=1 Tax=Nocardioides guangzhouensis TaxID=2497878 RepID=A0A4Q4ZK12_9ACTN|nr:hypothetical protein [Nocardioides guangzhouensis]RYP88663.1 hypothetical protein EKO23_01875 [Nocardioides guangzhouensis]
MGTDSAATQPGQSSSSAQPLDEEDLAQALAQVPVGERLEDAFSAYLLACISLGFAKTAAPQLRQRSAELGHHPLASALDHLAVSIAQKAVLDAAATYDQAGKGSSSLANALDLITGCLKDPTFGSAADREAARQLVAGIRNSVITIKSPEISAIRYWRNKWAGHRSVDPQVDPWAWEHPVDFAVIKNGLDQMRAAFREFALLLTQLPQLASLQEDARRVDDHTVRVGISLDGTTSWPIDSVLALGESQAQEFLDRTLPYLTSDSGRS